MLKLKNGKVDAEKNEEIKDDAKKAELPPTSSSLSVSSRFGDQFLKPSSDTSLISTVKYTTYVEINFLLDIKIQSEVPHIQSPSVLIVPVLMISEPLVLTPIPKTSLVALATTLLPAPSVSTRGVNDLRPVYNLLKGTCISGIELEYNMEECFKELTNRLDWNNPEEDRCPFNLTKPLPLKGRPCYLTVAAKYFFNNDLGFLKSSDPEKKYTTSITKTKAARYKIVGIEDMVPTLWSITKVGYDKDAKKGIKHWGERRKLWYRSQMNKFSKHNVYSTQKILSVVSVRVKKLHDYGHLEEITVRRPNRHVYKFKEGDYVDLHLNEIKDMILLAVQHK
ncbi:hypothetical protein Tco_1380446 [Tanacetum coccineum]